MAQLIDKDAVLAEIERLEKKNNESENVYDFGTEHALKSILAFINSLEVKEVNLEKELDSMITPELKFHKALPSLFDIAKHFFELGLKAQKGE